MSLKIIPCLAHDLSSFWFCTSKELVILAKSRIFGLRYVMNWFKIMHWLWTSYGGQRTNSWPRTLIGQKWLFGVLFQTSSSCYGSQRTGSWPKKQKKNSQEQHSKTHCSASGCAWHYHCCKSRDIQFTYVYIYSVKMMWLYDGSLVPEKQTGS